MKRFMLPVSIIVISSLLLCSCMKGVESCPAAEPDVTALAGSPTPAPGEPDPAMPIAPPLVTLTTQNEDRIQVMNGACEWHVPQGDGTVRTAIADAPHPLQCAKENLPMFRKPMLEKDETAVRVEFESVQPDSLTAISWPIQHLGGEWNDDFLTEIQKAEQTVAVEALDTNSGEKAAYGIRIRPGYVYQLHAQWEDKGSEWGRASYVFVTDGRSVLNIATEQTVWDDVEEPIFSDESYIYTLPGRYADQMIVYFSDGTTAPIKEALRKGWAQIGDLERFGVEYHKCEINYRG